MKHLKYILQGLLFLLLPLAGYGQPNTAYFYYYKGEKVFLEADTKTISLSVEDESSPAILKSLFNNSKVAPAPITEDYPRSLLVTNTSRQ